MNYYDGYIINIVLRQPKALDKHPDLAIFKEMATIVRTFTLEKLFNVQSESKSMNTGGVDERQIHALVVKSDKLYSINRDPLTPYTTDKVLCYT